MFMFLLKFIFMFVFIFMFMFMSLLSRPLLQFDYVEILVSSAQ
jgi:hypothetical protein